VWTPNAVVAWLEGLGIRPGGTVDVELIGYGGSGVGGAPGIAGLPDMPDRVAIVAPVAGPGLAMEGVTDRTEWHLFIRGPQGDPHTAYAMAYTADRLILAAAKSVELPGGTYLADVQRPGGRPAPVDFGPDGDRTTLRATYLTEINDG
jgi:hypothetical protein